jgi:hypothetical protein
MVKSYSKIITLSLIYILGSTSVVAQECPLGFKRPSYKTRGAFCSTGEFVKDAYNFDKNILCEQMEVDHLIPLKLAHCAGLSDKQLKRLANDPRNLKFTFWLTNRSKGAKDLHSFVETLDPKIQKKILIDGVNVMNDYKIPLGPKLSQELARRLALQSGQLASRQVRNQVSKSPAALVTFRGRKVAVEQAIALTANRISKRAVVASSRNLGSMAGQALPYVGTAVIVGVTALGLKDLCDTLIDMSELTRAVNPEMEISDDEVKVCSKTVPTKEELWEYAKASPGTAWAAAKEAMPTLDEINDYEMPDVDWTGAWTATTKGAGTVWQTTKDGTGAAVDTTIETTGGWIKGATEYFAGSEEDEK